MSQTELYDVLILGAGPGGYPAAIRASQLGLKAAVVEKDKPGGVCLNVGCIPSKSLIHQATEFRSLASLEGIGVKADVSGLDYSKVFKRSRTAADTLSRGVSFLLKKNKVELIPGEGRITGTGEVALKDGTRLKAKNIIVATGSRPRALPGFEFDEKDVLSSTGGLFLEKVPKRLLIMGAGAIGCEFAYIMNAFGAKVTLVEMLPQILPAEDAQIAACLEKAFRARGVEIFVSTKVESWRRAGDGSLEAVLAGPEGSRKAAFDKLLVVTGRVPNTEGIGLESAGIKTERGFIPVGDYGQTSVPGIYAIGDVTATPLLAHVASAEGELVVEHIAGLETPKRVDPLEVPMAVYTEPQVASFGLNETAAKKAGIKFATASFPFRGIGKAVAIEDAEGMAKVVYDPDSKEILGAQIVGPEATELIHELLLAKKAELFPADLTAMIHAHPTLSEIVLELMRAAQGHAIHA